MITVNGDEMEWRPGLSIQDVILKKKYTFKMLAVWVNDCPIDRAAFISTLIEDNAKIQIVHMISGG